MTCKRIAYQHPDLVVVGFGLGEGVVEDDVDGVAQGLVGVQLGDDDSVAVLVEQVRDAQHDVVVVDEGDGDRAWPHSRTINLLRGVPQPP